MAVIDEIKLVLGETLQLGARADGFTGTTPLFGAIPEFDSMAVVAVVTALEERFDIEFEDDEIDADVFATIGNLESLVRQKLEA
jgi:acyl carrier protein